MHQKYVHYFSNVSNNSILQEYGILPKNNEEVNVLKPKQCPNCNEQNRPDQKFCVKCRMVLTYGAYSETLELEQDKDRRIEDMTKKQEQFERLIHSLIDSGHLKPLEQSIILHSLVWKAIDSVSMSSGQIEYRG